MTMNELVDYVILQCENDPEKVEGFINALSDQVCLHCGRIYAKSPFYGSCQCWNDE